MTHSEAYDLLRDNIGTGDLVEKVNELLDDEAGLTLEKADELLQWLAEQIIDEDDA